VISLGILTIMADFRRPQIHLLRRTGRKAVSLSQSMMCAPISLISYSARAVRSKDNFIWPRAKAAHTMNDSLAKSIMYVELMIFYAKLSSSDHRACFFRVCRV
jgi:hypothetical protein